MSRCVLSPLTIGIWNQPPPAGASRRSSSSQSRVASRRSSKTSLFLPSPSKTNPSEPPYQRDGGRDHAGGHRIRQLFFLFLTTVVFSAQPARDQEPEVTGAADGVAFESSWPGSGGTGPSGRRTKQGGGRTDEEDEEEEEEIPRPLDTALAANPNVTALVSAPTATSSSLRRLVEATCAEIPSDSTSVEVVALLPTKHAPTRARAQAVSSRNDDRLPKMADEREQGNSVDEIEIVDAPHELRVPKSKPQSQPSDRPQPRHKHHCAAHQRCINPARCIHVHISAHLHALVHTAPQQHPSPITPLDMNSLASHPTDDPRHVQRRLSRHLYGPASPAVADLDAHRVVNTVASLPSHAPRACHPDGPMFGSVIPEPDGVDHDPGAGVDVVRGHASPGQGLNSDLASPSPAVFTVTSISEYDGNGAIDPSVLGGGGNNSPGKLGDDTNSPAHEFGGGGGAQPSRTTDEDEEEEEDARARAELLLWTASRHQRAFLPLLVRRKRWRKVDR
ncbi:hypothetical protein EDB83DRAFT_2518376 [Lactarius deliciosus]|nr:hypothetical protein EDB83DRAFT_2518376 [Lactarius deliciosus]